ncbi:AAA family ATPase [Streptacidiphilus sp. EB129]|uniref:AAA family ATPase n=1 Tax=Streptacidiphilus sp. EB129 TaxID=3156262 RepID=UPI00351967B2
MAAVLNTRRPTGVPPLPLILIEGDENAGKTWAAAQFTRCRRVGSVYWLDLGEGSADEYAAIPDARFEVLVHDGSYRSILEQIEAVHAEARRAADDGERPVVLVVDSISALWRMLTHWTYQRARRSDANRARLAANPDAVIEVPANLWIDRNQRWARVLWLLQTLPGIPIVLARGKETSAFDDNGKPIAHSTEWKVIAGDDLGFEATAWVRLQRGRPARLVKARSLRMPVDPGQPLELPEFSIEDLVFERLGCTEYSQPRVMPQLVGDQVQPWLDQVRAVHDLDQANAVWTACHPDRSGLSFEEAATVQTALRARVAELANPRPGLLDSPDPDAERLRAAAAQRAAAPGTDTPGPQASNTTTPRGPQLVPVP